MVHILLVEDHEDIWEFAARRLVRRGYEVILAHEGQDGVDKARTTNPDLILLDMNVPVMASSAEYHLEPAGPALRRLLFCTWHWRRRRRLGPRKTSRGSSTLPLAR